MKTISFRITLLWNIWTSNSAVSDDCSPEVLLVGWGMDWISPGGVSYRAPYGTKKYFIGNQSIDTWVLQLGTFLCQQISRLDLNQIYSGVIMIYIYLSLSGVALLSSLFTFCWNFRMSNTRNGWKYRKCQNAKKSNYGQFQTLAHFFSVTLNGNSGENITLFIDIFDSVLV